MTDRSDIPALALDWHLAGRSPVLATVVETWGSAPRPAGSLMVVAADGDMEGSVSGGCIEGNVVAEAEEARKDGQARLLDYGVSDETAFSLGLACGGRIRVLVEPVGSAMPQALLAQLVAARAARQPLAYVAALDGTARRLAEPPAFADRFRLDKSGVEPDDTTFVGIHNPPLRLIVVGAVHIAQALIPMARIVGFETFLIDPRAAFATEARFPAQALIEDWPDEAIAALAPDARTYVVTLTHDTKIDDPAITATLGSGAAYLGSLGSSRTHAKRTERLAAKGFAPETIARIHAPIGARIAAATPAEIAVSIMAEIISVLRGAK